VEVVAVVLVVEIEMEVGRQTTVIAILHFANLNEDAGDMRSAHRSSFAAR